jgi:hypothetical protein
MVLNEVKPAAREWALLNITANLSYNIYLFHWPLYKFFFQILWNNLLAAGAGFVLSIAFSVFVFYCIEPFFHQKQPLSIHRPPVLRRLLYTVISLFVLSSVVLSASAFERAPDINSLEAELNSGYLYQDVSEIEAGQRLVKYINKEPLYQPGAMPSSAPYQTSIIISSHPAMGTLAGSTHELLGVLDWSFNDDILPGATIVGDSVCLGAARKLSESIPNCYVDASGSRNMGQGYRLLMEMQNNGTLREYVVVALGTNQNPNSVSMIEKIIEDINPGHRLIFVTPYNGAMDETWNTYQIMQYIRTLPDKYSFITVADWAALIQMQPVFLGFDRIHIGGNTAAVNLYVDNIITAIVASIMKPEKP